MKRDWDVIREVLIEVEALNSATFDTIQYGPVSCSATPVKDEHAILLWKAAFIDGADAGGIDGDAVLAQSLSWQGHELLDTLRSKAVWERVKATAKEKGLELTFDAVKALGKMALEYVIKQGP